MLKLKDMEILSILRSKMLFISSTQYETVDIRTKTARLHPAYDLHSLFLNTNIILWLSIPFFAEVHTLYIPYACKPN